MIPSLSVPLCSQQVWGPVSKASLFWFYSNDWIQKSVFCQWMFQADVCVKDKSLDSCKTHKNIICKSCWWVLYFTWFSLSLLFVELKICKFADTHSNYMYSNWPAVLGITSNKVHLKFYWISSTWLFESLLNKQLKMVCIVTADINGTASSEFGTYRLCEQRRFRRACASAQSRQNLRCSPIQAVSQEEPSDRKPDP